MLVGWTLFRTASLAELAALWGRLLAPTAGLLWLPPLPLMALGLLLLEHAVWVSPYRQVLTLPADRHLTPWLVGLALAALVLVAPTGVRPVVYLQV